MSLFQRLTRTLRPTSFNVASVFRAARSPRTPRMDPNFFKSSNRVGLGRRSYWATYRNHYPMNMRIVYGIIGLNTGIFLYANYLEQQARQGYPESLFNYFKNMTISLRGFFDEHRYWTALTSCFSHVGFMHVFGNMLSFFYMGELVACVPYFTPVRFLTLILGSGIAGSAVWMYSAWHQGEPDKRALGFSGSVMGVGTVAAFLFPRTTFHIYGIIPVPLALLMAGYALYDGYYINSKESTIAHGGHLGGLAFGLLYCAKLMRLRR